MLSYLKLKTTRPELFKKYQSPLGTVGGFIGLGLGILALLSCFSNPSYRYAIIGVVIVMAISVLYFLIFGRHEIVAQAPEEKAALLARSQQIQ